MLENALETASCAKLGNTFVFSERVITRRDLFERIHGRGRYVGSAALDVAFEEFPEFRWKHGCCQQGKKALRLILLSIEQNFQKPKISRKKDIFLSTYADWLDTPLPDFTCSACQTPFSTEKRGSGRPQIDFRDTTQRSKDRRTLTLRRMPNLELSHAVIHKLRARGFKEEAKVVRAAMFPTDTGPKPKQQIVQNSKEEALALCQSNHLSVRCYQSLRNNAIGHNARALYPPYRQVKQAKEECLSGNITVSEREAEVPLQDALDLDHTACRLILLQQTVLDARSSSSVLILDTKWGFDGLSGHALYRMIFIRKIQPYAANVFNLRLKTFAAYG